MALGATIYKAAVQRADIDRGVYDDLALTLARHPSESEERLAVRLLAYALNAPADGDVHAGTLSFGAGLSDTESADLLHSDDTGRVLHWIELGQPDERRIAKACARADRVCVYAYAAASPVWWRGAEKQLARWRAPKLTVWLLDAQQVKGLAALVARNMRWQITVQDGAAMVSSDSGSVQIEPLQLNAA